MNSPITVGRQDVQLRSCVQRDFDSLVQFTDHDIFQFFVSDMRLRTIVVGRISKLTKMIDYLEDVRSARMDSVQDDNALVCEYTVLTLPNMTGQTNINNLL